MRIRIVGILTLIICLFAIGCVTTAEGHEQAPQNADKPSGQAYLYGEYHGNEDLTMMQYDLWYDYYTKEGMRHMFLEYPYFSAEFLNLWMKEENDDTLLQVYSAMEGTSAHYPEALSFFRRIKENLPETLFHGTDVGHQYYTLGARYLRYLEQQGMKDSKNYILAEHNINQGRDFYIKYDSNHSKRSEMMVENFVREFDALGGESIMSGFYGLAHISEGNYPDYMGSGITFATRLKEIYGDRIHLADLTKLNLLEEGVPDTLEIDGRTFTATYFGEEYISWFSDVYSKRAFWRVEEAYEDFKAKPKTGDMLPYGNYPVTVELRQVFAIRYTRKDGEEEMLYYRSDGSTWQGVVVTEQFITNK